MIISEESLFSLFWNDHSLKSCKVKVQFHFWQSVCFHLPNCHLRDKNPISALLPCSTEIVTFWKKQLKDGNGWLLNIKICQIKQQREFLFKGSAKWSSRKTLPIVETRAELTEPQNLSSDKRFPNDLVCFAVFLSVKLTSDDSVIQLPKTFTSKAYRRHMF